jgi:C4-dicarboxylate-specific signal transduction histidine kinase
VAPRGEGAFEHADLHDVLRVSLRIVRGELRQRTEIELDLAPAPEVVGSATQLGQIVLNLLASAIEGVRSLPASERLVTLRVRALGRAVQLDVEDSGPPIPEDDLRYLFDPFHSSNHPRGTGFGLAISRAIVDDLGGTLSVENRDGGGVLFRLSLSAVPDPAHS